VLFPLVPSVPLFACCLQLWPTDLVPLRPVGKMVLDTNIDNFFAEAEQIAFCPAITVPGEPWRPSKASSPLEQSM